MTVVIKPILHDENGDAERIEPARVIFTIADAHVATSGRIHDGDSRRFGDVRRIHRDGGIVDVSEATVELDFRTSIRFESWHAFGPERNDERFGEG